jgi:hypothetical protein
MRQQSPAVFIDRLWAAAPTSCVCWPRPTLYPTVSKALGWVARSCIYRSRRRRARTRGCSGASKSSGHWSNLKKKVFHLVEQAQRAGRPGNVLLKAIDAMPAGRLKQCACQALGEPRHRGHPDRRQRLGPNVEPAIPAAPHRLTAAQGQAILDPLHSERFVDASPRPI